MTEFTLWDILRNLLLATRWTIVLSLVSFVGGGLVGLLLLFMRIGRARIGRVFAKYYVELSKAGTVVTNATFQPFIVYGLVALIYFALCWPLSKSSQILERKLNVAHRNH